MRVGVRLRPGAAPFAEFDAPKLPQESGTLPPADRLAAALGLIPAEIGFENHRPTRFAAGNTFAFVPVASLEAMAKARVASHALGARHCQGGIGRVPLLPADRAHHVRVPRAHVRPRASACPRIPRPARRPSALPASSTASTRCPTALHKRTIEQGFEMGRPSLIELSLQVEGGKLDAVRIGGHAVRVAEGTIEV